MHRRTRAGLIFVAAVGMASLLAAPVSAVSAIGPNIIGFESDPSGSPSQPLTSKDNPTVRFRASSGSLSVVACGQPCNGQGLQVGSPAESILVVRFDVPVKRLSVAFGNDCCDLTNRAVLKVYRGPRLVATRRVAWDNAIDPDQRVTYEGRAITRATFAFTTQGGIPSVTLSETVDDIQLAHVCEIDGNAASNALAGNAGHNGICGLGGADRIRGRAGNDVLVGGGGDDRLKGETGNDLLNGGPGDDTIRAQDGVEGNDTVYGGTGNDKCFIDLEDNHFGCETVISPF